MKSNINPEIAAVTVFPDRALITMRGEFKIQPGAHEVLIAGLPIFLEKDSVRVRGNADIPLKISGVDIRQEFFEAYPVSKVAELVASLEEVEDELAALEDEADIQRSQGEYLDGLREASDAFAKGLSRGKSKIADQTTLLEFLQDQDRSVKSSVRKITREKRQITNKKEKLERQLAELKSAAHKKLYQAIIGIEAEGEGVGNLEFSYIVSRASWTPLYDMRMAVQDGGQELSITAIAEITQETGQDWTGVDLSISTSRPAIHQRIPELKPDFLREYRPPVAPMPEPRFAATPMRAVPAQAAPAADSVLEEVADFEAEVVTAQLEGEPESSITFRIPGKTDIPSDGSPHKRSLSVSSLVPNLEYFSIPKHTDAVFRRLKVENSTDHPLLAGKANLFASDEYIGSTGLKYVPTGGELELLFGVEERITVSRELAKREVEKALLRDKRQIHFGYEIEIRNLLTTTAEIELKDQIPVSRNESIKAQLDKAEPRPVEISDLNIMEWHLNIEPGEEKKIIIEYTVEHPRGMRVIGLGDD